MKHNFLFFIFVFLLIANAGMVLATGFSPSKIVLELQPNEVSCQVISVTSESSVISVDDKWASNVDVCASS